MENYSVTISGFPPTLNLLKLKLFIETRVSSGCVQDTSRNADGSVTFVFKDREGLSRFHQSNIREYKFGSSTHRLQILKIGGGDNGSSSLRGATENLHSSSASNYGHSKPPRPKINILDVVTQKNLYENIYSWSNLPLLPTDEGSRCVLVHGIDPSKTHIQKVTMHFQSKKRSNGGPVFCIIGMVDGLLIIFKDQRDCDSCLEKADQKFEDEDLEIFPKLVPVYFQKVFVLKGVGPDTQEDTLIMFLESCSENEINPINCVKTDIQGVYWIEYGDDFDIAETESLLKNIKSRKLEGNSLKATPLLKTDCLKVSNIPVDSTNDTIRLVFQSKKRTGGGPVTRIDRLENNCALVYFAMYTDAERVYERFKNPADKLSLNNQQVGVELYHHSLSNDHETVLKEFQPTPKMKTEPIPRSRARLQEFELKPTGNEKIIDFLTKSQKHGFKLKNHFKHLATVDFKFHQQGQDRILVVFTIADQKMAAKETQNSFNEKCEKFFKDFLAEYTTISHTFDETKLQNARFHKISTQIDENYTGNVDNDDLVVCWKKNESVIEMTGMKASVDHMLMHIKNCVSCAVVDMPVDKHQFWSMVNCGVVKELRMKYNNVQIKCDDEQHKITLTGPESTLQTMQINALTILSTLEKKRLVGLDESVLRFLSESLSKSDELAKKIQEQLRNDNVRAMIMLYSDDPCLQIRNNDDFKRGMEVIKQYIVVDTIRTDKPKADVVNSPVWKGFHQTLRGKNSYGVYTKPNECIQMVGLRTEVKLLRVEITKFLDAHAIKRFFMQMLYGKARFVVERSSEFTMEACERKSITCGLSPEGGGGVFVEGKTKALDDAFDEMTKLRESIIESKHTFEEPGIKKYYQEDEGKQFLDQTGKINKCIILTMTRENAEWVEFNKNSKFLPVLRSTKSSSVDLEEEKIISVTLAKTSVKLKVWKTDIIKHRCDVIVNASNPELTLLPGGVSGVISKLDRRNGNVIQNEMTTRIQENHGNFLPGGAAITSAGNLPACKMIVHAVGPRWTSKSERGDPKLLLQQCVYRSLELVEGANLKSIAIPAISCGVFGGKINVCIPLILDAVADYFKENHNSCIKQVDFVENSNQQVLDAFEKTVKQHQNEESSTKVSSKSTLSPNQAAGFTMIPNPNCDVSIVVGDISSHKADVIVNVTDRKHVTNISQAGVVSQLLAQKAGQAVVQQCANLPPPFNRGDVRETSGGSLPCKQLYHAIVGHYDQNLSQGVIQAVVSNCLQRADVSGHKSIVFPAIATGGFQHPPNLVAKWMKQEISQFQGNFLKKVFIVLYSGNTPVISAFNAEFNTGLNARSSQASSSQSQSNGTNVFVRKLDSRTTSFGSLKVSVLQGDITEQHTDVIVNSTNDRFDLSQGMVSTQILRKGGSSIQTEASTQPGGDFAVTSGGALPCKKIIHLVVPNNPKDLQKKILQALFEVKNLRLSSVSLPAFGTGNLKMDCSTVGSIMRSSIEVFVKSNPNLGNLQHVNVVIFDKKMLKDFKDAILSETAKKGVWMKLVEWGKSFFSGGTSAEEIMKSVDNSLDLYFYSTDQEHIYEAMNAIKKEILKVSHKQTIEDEVIPRLTDWEKFEMGEIAKTNKIVIQDISTRYISRLELVGLTKDVMKAHEAVKDVLKEFTAAETCAAYINWQRKGHSGTWEDLPIRAVHKLEMAFKKRKGNKTDPALNHILISEFQDGKVVQQTIDLSKLENDHHGNDPPKIKRVIKEKSTTNDIPSSWGDMSGTPVKKVTLLQNSPEYQKVLAKFTNAGLPFQNIVSIERIQNLSLHRQYMARKAEITGKRQNLGKPIERELFHGTANDDQIILHGFDRSYAGLNATAYGRGVYFATTARYSHSYAIPNPQNRRMFLANVITADYCQGNQNIVAPPPRQSNIKNDLFDSVVDNVSGPSIFVIFKDASAYPTYRVTYH